MTKEIERPLRAKGVVHKQIAATAKGLAEEHYAQLCSNPKRMQNGETEGNVFYKRWPKVRAFVAHNWRLYVDMARQLLTAMLGDPKYDQKFKDQILDVLLKDGAVNPKKMAIPEKPRFFLGPT